MSCPYPCMERNYTLKDYKIKYVLAILYAPIYVCTLTFTCQLHNEAVTLPCSAAATLHEVSTESNMVNSI